MNLVYYPNKILDTPTVPVTVFDEQLQKELADMEALMLKYNGLGIAANQCGLNKSMFIIKDQKGAIHKIVNPKIISTDGNVSISEGCLSFPTTFIAVVRPEFVELEYQNEKGEVQQVLAQGMDARAIQHEYDHLLGYTFLTRVNRATRKAVLSQHKRLMR
jgi:peptide deformylase